VGYGDGDLHPGQIPQRKPRKRKPKPRRSGGGGGGGSPQPDRWQIEAWKYRHGHPPRGPAELRKAASEWRLAALMLQYATKHGSLQGFVGPGDRNRRRRPSGGGGGGGGGRPSGGGNSGGGNGGSGGGGGTAGRIAQFFHRKGVPGYLIAGIIGNLSVESSLNSHAYNSGEGAIGLVQWEGGRRAALQAFARQHGGSEGDLNTQLEFLWHEMHTSESAAWNQVRQAGNVREAAALWDQYYERSSGSSRQQRVSRAIQFAQSGHLPGGTGGGGGGYGGGGGGEFSSNPSRSDYRAVDSLGDLLASVPALKHLVEKASRQGWTVAKFQNEVQDSHWWKSHSDTARQVLITQANDPATFHQNLGNAEFQIRSLAQQMGMDLDPATIRDIANTALLTGNNGNTDWLQHQIGKNEDYSHLHSTAHLTGEMAANAQQLQQVAGAYGLRWSPAEVAHRAKMVTMGVTTLDTYRQQAVHYAKSLFPSFGRQLDEGQTMIDIANPYISTASQLLEQSPGNFDLYNPLIKQGLQGIGRDPEKGPANLKMWQFEDLVRKDPRWQYTDNAHSTMASLALQLGQNWGFNG
jgi:hypothetical protein